MATSYAITAKCHLQIPLCISGEITNSKTTDLQCRSSQDCLSPSHISQTERARACRACPRDVTPTAAGAVGLGGGDAADTWANLGGVRTNLSRRRTAGRRRTGDASSGRRKTGALGGRARRRPHMDRSPRRRWEFSERESGGRERVCPDDLEQEFTGDAWLTR